MLSRGVTVLVVSGRMLCLAAVVLLMTLGAAMSQSDDYRLIKAVEQGDAPAVASMLKAGMNVDVRNERRQTALLVATHANNVAIARVLIEAGADVNAKDDIQDSPYLYAGARGHLEILKLTLAHGADLRSTNRYGGTALIPASERGHVETVDTLISAGVDVNHVNNLGWTALLEAIILSDGGPKHVQIVKRLVDAGADVELADRDNVTPIEHAQNRGYTEIVAILEGDRFSTFEGAAMPFGDELSAIWIPRSERLALPWNLP